MPEIETKGTEEIKTGKAEVEPSNKSGLGDLLRAEREKKGLSHDQVARSTRLRRHYIEALEKEEWENLPSPVFVKGFIRSYARTIGLDEGVTLDLYKKIATFEEKPPKPLVEPKRSKSGSIFLIGILLFLAMAVSIYMLTSQEAKPPISTNKKEAPKTLERPEKNLKPAIPKREEIQPLDLKESAPPVTESEPVIKQELGPIVQEADIEPEKPSIPEDLPTEQEHPRAVAIENSSSDESSEPASALDMLVLTAVVNMRTYIKIYVDDKQPKEYIFRPGSRPQWKAREGFDILVGNAGGIEFDFNGKRIKDLGGLGKVVRLRLPKEFESSIYED